MKALAPVSCRLRKEREQAHSERHHHPQMETEQVLPRRHQMEKHRMKALTRKHQKGSARHSVGRFVHH